MNAKEEVYALLEQKMLSYVDYEGIEVDPGEDAREFVMLSSRSSVLAVEPIGDTLTNFQRPHVLVRGPIVDKLHLAGQHLKDRDRSLQLCIVYGYRPLEEQRRLFEGAKSLLASESLDGALLLEAAHRRIALPEVAGHPTGGAVDVHILRDGQPVEMGTQIWEFTPDAFTFSPFISREAWDNRQLLRQVMMAVGFAPFDGEWWHFSYGDKEWARYYARSTALYSQIEESAALARLEDILMPH